VGKLGRLSCSPLSLDTRLSYRPLPRSVSGYHPRAYVRPRRPPQSAKEISASLIDDRSPLLDMMNCIVCDHTMKLEKIDPDDGGITSSNIGANSAAASSDCVCFAEVANKAGPRRTIALSYSKRHLSPFKNEKLRRYHTEKLAVGTKPRKWRSVGLLSQT
jgi:hypothetical protein